MAYSAATYKGDGSQSTFIIPFDYLQKDFVKVTINEVDKVYAQDYNVDGRELSFPTAPPSGSIIKVYRETPTDRMVKWNEGSVLTSSNMTTQQIQELHLIEETTYNLEDSAMVKTEDGHKWEGKYLPIIHVGDPTDDSDAVNLGTMLSKYNEYLAFLTATKDAVKDSEANASKYKDEAKTSERNAKASEVAAAESARQSAAGQINSDWNEIDESSPAFIKNKPNVYTKTESDTKYAEKMMFWEVDVKGGIMPTVHPVYSKSFELDSYGDITTVL